MHPWSCRHHWPACTGESWKAKERDGREGNEHSWADSSTELQVQESPFWAEHRHSEVIHFEGGGTRRVVGRFPTAGRFGWGESGRGRRGGSSRSVRRSEARQTGQTAHRRKRRRCRGPLVERRSGTGAMSLLQPPASVNALSSTERRKCFLVLPKFKDENRIK